jgi:7-cyano-7-deazaguanine synthase
MLAQRLGGMPLVDLIRDRTVTCYQGDIETTHEWGRGCGECLARKLREHGFNEFSDAPA